MQAIVNEVPNANGIPDAVWAVLQPEFPPGTSREGPPKNTRWQKLNRIVAPVLANAGQAIAPVDLGPNAGQVDNDDGMIVFNDNNDDIGDYDNNADQAVAVNAPQLPVAPPPRGYKRRYVALGAIGVMLAFTGFRAYTGVAAFPPVPTTGSIPHSNPIPAAISSDDDDAFIPTEKSVFKRIREE